MPSTEILPEDHLAETMPPGAQRADSAIAGPAAGLPADSGWIAPTADFSSDAAVTNNTPPSLDASPWAQRAEPPVPTQIGRYFILKAIGEGGMGAVYLAEQREPIKRKVALKLIRGEFASKQMLIRFDSERQALARMDHANVAKVLDAGTSEQGQPYFVMEYVPGKPIDQYADEKKLDLRARLRLFLQACHAIAHAHAKAMIHRDIKAGNVLAYDDTAGKPAVKVIDFGIAKAVGDEKLVEATATIGAGTVLGTPYAMSPEQADGNADIDTRTDVYALGVLLYELLVGRPPLAAGEFAGLSISKMLELVRTKEPPRPSVWLEGAPRHEAEKIASYRSTKPATLVSDLRRELEWIPLKALRKDREERYASVVALSEDVENYLSSRPLKAGRQTRLYHARKFARRNWKALAAASVVAAVMLYICIDAVTLSRSDKWDLQMTLDKALAQEREANSKVRAASEVGRFARDAFVAASPYAGNANASLADGIRAATTQLDERKPFEAEPALRAILDLQLAEILSDAGDFGTAIKQLDSAIPTLVAQGDNRQLLAHAYHLRGWVHYSLKRLEEAAADDQSALELERALQPSGSIEEAATMQNVALLKLDQGALDAAEQMSTDALTMLKKQQGESRDISSGVYLTLGGVAERRHRLPEARRAYEMALAESLAVFASNDIRIGRALNNLGNVLAQLGEFDAAVDHLSRALASQTAHGTDQLDEGLKTTATLASALRESGQLADAEAMSRRAIAGMEKRLPGMAKELANAQSGLGRTLILTPGSPSGGRAVSPRRV